MGSGMWESIDEHTQRLKVPGGWIYRVGEGLVLVPESDPEPVPKPEPSPKPELITGLAAFNKAVSRMTAVSQLRDIGIDPSGGRPYGLDDKGLSQADADEETLALRTQLKKMRGWRTEVAVAAGVSEDDDDADILESIRGYSCVVRKQDRDIDQLCAQKDELENQILKEKGDLLDKIDTLTRERDTFLNMLKEFDAQNK